MQEMVPPDHIVTAYLEVSTIIVSHENDVVTLLGAYANLTDDTVCTITFHLGFYQLNELLSLITDQADDAVAQIASALNDPAGEHTMIKIAEEGGLRFHGHLFSFHAVYEENEDALNSMQHTGTYVLMAYIAVDGILPSTIHTDMPTGKAYLDYLHKALAAKYRLYLHLANLLPAAEARACSSLDDDVSFAMAKEYYQLFI